MGKGSSSEPAGSALHTVGSRVWVWKDDWKRGEVVSMSGPRLRVRLEGGEEHECTAAEIPLQNSSAAGVEVGLGHAAGSVWAQPCCRPPQPQSVGQGGLRPGQPLAIGAGLPRLCQLPARCAGARAADQLPAAAA